DFVQRRFPHIYERCLAYGMDITAQPIPVVPAAHYCCGGARTETAGATNIQRLFAAGEVAMTGLHGANRLASNSLLEALVFGHRAARNAIERAERLSANGAVQDSIKIGNRAADSEDTAGLRLRLKSIMNDYAGIVRNDGDLYR